MINPIIKRLKQHKKDSGKGIYAVCSANRFVIEAALLQAKSDSSMLLIESTSNQVDQFGGYMGMTPEKFSEYVFAISEKYNFPQKQLLLGGDHLGPNVWRYKNADAAMRHAAEQVAAYTNAGYTKIHLDTSMPLKGDSISENGFIPIELNAERAADLCVIVENVFNKRKKRSAPPVYIIGADVPIPGGTQDDIQNTHITSPTDLNETIECTRQAFWKRGLKDAWQRVVAVVVQPGVEFSGESVIEYDRNKTKSLVEYINTHNQMVFEVHSTDYQKPVALKNMVNDHFAILKVGPWLTYAFREAVFALAAIEQEYLSQTRGTKLSGIRQIIESTMVKHPDHWVKHYHGDENQKKLARAFSLSDRVRYYWSNTNISEALNHLIHNLTVHKIPASLISQYFPNQYWGIRNWEINLHPISLIHERIREVLKYYSDAAGMD